MSMKNRLALVGLVMLITACGQAQPTPLFLLTSTRKPATSTPTAMQPTATNYFTPQPSPLAHPTVSLAASITPTLSPVPGSRLIESTQPSASPTPDTPWTEPVQPSASSTPDNRQIEPTYPSASPTPDSPRIEPARPSASPTPEQAFPPTIGLEPVLTGFKNPVYLTNAGETPPWSSRLLIVEKAGRIVAVENDHVQPAPFLDIVDRVGSGGSEQGLLSVAFPRDFDTSRVFYVNYTDSVGDTVIARYRLLDENPLQGDPTSEQKLLKIPQPADNHNGGQLQFGPDGYLYIGTGDGGRGGDPWGNAQNPKVLLGKMLRIDVVESDTYRIPQDNPFLDQTNVRSEIWALGLRNPWRFSFDRATGDLYIADVGQGSFEEVHFQPAYSTGGENYGWDILEGQHCFEPTRGCDSTGLITPVVEYTHDQGCSITGGYVYRGGRYPEMNGVYFFGDFCTGLIWGMRQAPSGAWESALLLDTDVTISSFGQDAAGEIYVLGFGDGTIYQLATLANSLP